MSETELILGEIRELRREVRETAAAHAAENQRCFDGMDARVKLLEDTRARLAGATTVVGFLGALFGGLLTLLGQFLLNKLGA